MIDAVLSDTAQEKRSGEARRRIQINASAEQAFGRSGVEIHDLSRRGLMMRCSESFTVGEPLLIDMPGLGEREARIAWTKDGRCGCHFLERLEREELGIVLAEARREALGEAPETLGERLRRLRKASHFTMLELAGAVGVSKPTLWKWESDRVRPRDTALRSLAAALETSEVALLYGENPPERGAEAAEPKEAASSGVNTLAQTVASARRAIAEHAGVSVEAVQIHIDWDA